MIYLLSSKSKINDLDLVAGAADTQYIFRLWGKKSHN